MQLDGDPHDNIADSRYLSLDTRDPEIHIHGYKEITLNSYELFRIWFVSANCKELRSETSLTRHFLAGVHCGGACCPAGFAPQSFGAKPSNHIEAKRSSFIVVLIVFEFEYGGKNNRGELRFLFE